MVAQQSALFESLISYKAFGFTDSHALLFLNKGKSSERKKTVQDFAKRYNLKIITFDKSRTNPAFKKALRRFAADERDDVFLLNPKKRHVAILRGQHPCLLEQEFFNVLWDSMPLVEETSK